MKKYGEPVGLRRIPGLPAGGGEILSGRGHNSWNGPQYREGRRVSRQKLRKIRRCLCSDFMRVFHSFSSQRGLRNFSPEFQSVRIMIQIL